MGAYKPNNHSAFAKAHSQNVEMPDVNRVMIAGELIFTPPLRHTRRGIPVTNFVICTKPETKGGELEGMERTPTHVSVVAWGQQAAQCCAHLHKGSSVLIVGELQSMPRAHQNTEFKPVQINAHWIQFLDKGTVQESSYSSEEYEERDNDRESGHNDE